MRPQTPSHLGIASSRPAFAPPPSFARSLAAPAGRPDRG